MCVYKAWTKENAIAMTKTINEPCTGWLHKNCYFMGNDTFESGGFKFVQGDLSFLEGENE